MGHSLRAKNINLFDLMPLFRLNRGDGGFYIDKACVVSRDPDDWDNDDVENVGCYRLMVKGPNRIGIQTVPQHDISIQLAHAEARGEDLPVAITVSNEPIVSDNRNTLAKHIVDIAKQGERDRQRLIEGALARLKL